MNSSVWVAAVLSIVGCSEPSYASTEPIGMVPMELAEVEEAVQPSLASDEVIVRIIDESEHQRPFFDRRFYWVLVATEAERRGGRRLRVHTYDDEIHVKAWPWGWFQCASCSSVWRGARSQAVPVPLAIQIAECLAPHLDEAERVKRIETWEEAWANQTRETGESRWSVRVGVEGESVGRSFRVWAAADSLVAEEAGSWAY